MLMQCEFIANKCILLHNAPSARLITNVASHCNASWTEPGRIHSPSW